MVDAHADLRDAVDNCNWRVLGKYYFVNLCVFPIYEAGQKDSQVHTYNENLQSTFVKMLKCNFAMFSIWQASTWQTGVDWRVEERTNTKQTNELLLRAL